MLSPIRLLAHSFVLSILLVGGCGTPEDTQDLSDGDARIRTEDVRTSPDVVIGSPCKSASDCDPTSPCMPGVECLQDRCTYTYAIAGAPCAKGCFVNGACDGEGSCTNLFPKECPEADGNICTAPSCDPATGECYENVIADGLPPYVSSDCFEGSVCVNGEQDNAEANPSTLALECEAMGDDLDPFGCLAMYVCVGGVDPCKPIYKVDGTQCWTGGGDGCTGQSCAGGKCVFDNGYDVQCGVEDYPAQCHDTCQTCTELVCSWIPDPANPAAPTKQVRYCKPEAKVGYACSSDSCLLGQVCSLGSQANGPLGKETLGACTGGLEKSKEQCLEELGKPALPCLLAGIQCNPAAGGCALQQQIADKWCWPPEWQCFDKNDTYCSHLDSGDNWNEENGCHTAWVDLNCDDNNDCTVDLCKVEGDQWKCEHQPIDGAGCDDGDPCTLGGICVAGVCAQQQPKCTDNDDNPCNNPTCDPYTGECKPAQTNGYPCNDGNACTIGDTCQDLVCNSGAPKSCNDGNLCTDDFCDTDTGCLHDNNVSPCDDGNAATVGDICADGQCKPGAAIVCNDDNPCTADSPHPVKGCEYTPAPGPCSDDDVCTVNDSCAGGKCVSGPGLNCDDGLFCTIDSCNAVQGCGHANLPDYTSCPGGVNYGCKAGQCVCLPECGGKTCGSDGCNGSCGTCSNGQNCLNGNCFCVADCTNKQCGSDGCSGSCGSCDPDQECVAGKCEGGGELDPNGNYSVTPSINYSCTFGLVSLNFSSFQFSDNGSTLTVSPAMNGCCTLKGDSAEDGSFTATCLCPGGCDENYKLTGTFTSNKSWQGTFSVQFTGSCFNCSYQSWSVTGTK